MENQKLPEYITKYFWGDNLEELSLKNNYKYILQTILEKGDQIAVHWMFQNFSPNQIKKDIHTLKLSSKSTNFWNIYLA